MDDIEVLTFDCYGTLVQWTEGVRATLDALRREKAAGVSLDDLFDSFDGVEKELQLGPYMTLREQLPLALSRAFGAHGIPWDDADGARMVETMRGLAPFPDTRPALETLGRHFRLVIISNSDNDIIAENAAAIGVEFDDLVTAERARAYKPATAMFDYAFEAIGVPPERRLHIARSAYHDIVPAQKLGFPAVWINRGGEVAPPGMAPLAELADLSTLPAWLGVGEQGEGGTRFP